MSTADIIDHPLPMVVNPDGSITRAAIPTVAADPNSPSSPVLSKDVPLNQTHQTWIRLFLPKATLDVSSTAREEKKKLPLVVYFHGGGMVLCSAANTVFHNFCSDMALQVPSIVASVEFRLAPEHRLPAAYEDAVEAVHWIRTSTDEWITEFADLSNCFLMGNSGGGNVAYYGGIFAGKVVHDLAPVQIRGLILNQAFFSGEERSSSEERLINDEVLPLVANHLLWDLALPIGFDRDHKYSNPTVDGESMELLRSLGWTVVVTGCDGDPLIDRQRELAKVLMEKGVAVVCMFDETGVHGCDLTDETRASGLFEEITRLAALKS